MTNNFDKFELLLTSDNTGYSDSYLGLGRSDYQVRQLLIISFIEIKSSPITFFFFLFHLSHRREIFYFFKKGDSTSDSITSCNDGIHNL